MKLLSPNSVIVIDAEKRIDLTQNDKVRGGEGDHLNPIFYGGV